MRRSAMSVYKIRIPASLYQQIKLGVTSYSDKQKAIQVLTEGFRQNDIKFNIVKEEDKVRFLNDSGGELAAIVPL